MRAAPSLLLLAALVAHAEPPFTADLFAPRAAQTAPTTTPAVTTPGPTPEPVASGRFEVGSYGRVGLGSDLRGQTGRSANLVAHGPRLLEAGYAEFELRRIDTLGSVTSHVVATLALFAPFFQFDGQATQQMAVRNLYAEAELPGGVSAWVGSRMVRGDDAYLLDLRPMDDLNVVGGGGALRLGERTRLTGLISLQRLANSSSLQSVQTQDPTGPFAVSVVRLDRPRLIESVKLVHDAWGGELPGRVALYGEVHELSAGVWRHPVTGDERGLPADWGALAGAQLSVWQPKSLYAHLWLRHAVGLATVDELAMPQTTNNELTTQGARSTRAAAALGWESGAVGVQAGAYLDLVRDASVTSTTSAKYDEGAVAVRGHLMVTDVLGLAAEASHQARVLALPDPQTGALRTGNVTQFAVMPYLSPLGRGLSARPHLRLIYAASLRDAGAQAMQVVDPSNRRAVEHYVGLSVEWWFNSPTAPGRMP